MRESFGRWILEAKSLSEDEILGGIWVVTVNDLSVVALEDIEVADTAT